MRLEISYNRIHQLIIQITIFYIIFFQYCFYSIPYILPVLGLLSLLFAFRAFKINRDELRARDLAYIFVFLGYSLISSLLFSDNVPFSISLIGSVLAYFILTMSIYAYASNQIKLKSICKSIFISVVFLCIFLFIKGEINYYGAWYIDGLNINLFSSYCLLGCVAGSYISFTDSTRREVIETIIGSIIMLISVFLVASRRGVIVVSAYLIFAVLLYLKKNLSLSNRIVIAVGAFILLMTLFCTLDFSFLTDKFVVFKRFLGEYDTGDNLRNKYQLVALNLFFLNPIFGKGFGCVQNIVGLYSHSMYYEIISCTGIVGALIFYIPLIRKFIFYKHNNIIDWLISISMICVLISGIAVVYIYDFDFYLLLIILSCIKRLNTTLYVND